MNEQNIRVGNTISQLDTNLGKWITYNKVTQYADGSAINDAKVAASAGLYIKVENEYFLQEHSEGLSTDSMHIDSSGATDVSEALIVLLTIGRYLNKKIKIGNIGDIFLVSKTLPLTAGMLVYGNGTLLRAPNTGVNLLQVVGTNITVDGLSFNGNRANQSIISYNSELVVINASYCTIKNCKIWDGRVNGIAAFNSSYCNYENNEILNCYANSIILADGASNYNTIKDNKCINTDTQNCIFLTASSGSVSTSANLYGNSIINNKCYGAGDIGIESGIQSHNTIITCNDIRRSKNEAIIIRDNTGNIITNNTIDSTRKINGEGTGFGISFHDQLEENRNIDYRAICSGNIIQNYANVGINTYVKGIKIFDNIISKSATGGAAINITYGIYSVYNNKIIGGETGIRMMDTNITDVDIYNNTVADTTYFINTNKTLTNVSVFGNRSNKLSQFTGATFVNTKFFDNEIPTQVLPPNIGKTSNSRIISLPTTKFAANIIIIKPINGLMIISSNTINAIYHLSNTSVTSVISTNGIIGQTGQKYNIEYENGAWVIKRQADTNANDIASINVAFLEA